MVMLPKFKNICKYVYIRTRKSTGFGSPASYDPEYKYNNNNNNKNNSSQQNALNITENKRVCVIGWLRES